MADSSNDLVTWALRTLGAIQSGATPEAGELTDGFEALNSWLDGLATQRATIYNVARNVYSLSASTASYTIGSGATFSQARPLWIENIGIIDDDTASPVNEIPIGPLLTEDEFARISQKTTEANYPSAAYYDYGFASSLGTIHVYPVPDNSSVDIVLYTPTALTQLADQTTEYSFPPGYLRAIQFNLAMEIAPSYGLQPLPYVAEVAKTSLAWVKTANWRPEEARFDEALLQNSSHGSLGRWNIYTDQR